MSIYTLIWYSAISFFFFHQWLIKTKRNKNGHFQDQGIIKVALPRDYRRPCAAHKPILVRITGVTTARRFPSSAKFVEFPVAGKSFPLRNAMSWSLKRESSVGLTSLFCFGEKRDGGSWIEASTIVFWKYIKHKKRKVALWVCRNQKEYFRLLRMLSNYMLNNFKRRVYMKFNSSKNLSVKQNVWTWR